MSHNKALDNLTREQLTELLEIYSKNWLAADGIWFQSVEKKHGMEEAMYHDVEIWKKFTVGGAGEGVVASLLCQH